MYVRADVAAGRDPDQQPLNLVLVVMVQQDVGAPAGARGGLPQQVVQLPFADVLRSIDLRHRGTVSQRLLASTMLYPLPNTKTFDVRQMIRSRSTIVRMRSRNFHNSRC